MSCLALTFFYDYAESHGVSRAALQADLPYPVTWLEDRLNWVDWDTFLEIERRVAERFPSKEDLFFDVGSTFAATKGLGFIRVVVRGVFSPYQVYSRFPSLVSRFLFPFVTITIHREGPNRIRARYLFRPGFAPTQAFLDTVRGILSGVPQVLGAPPAQVKMRRETDLDIHFDIEVARWTGFVERVRSWFGAVTMASRIRIGQLTDAATELESANELLQEKLIALTEAKQQLDNKVSELTLLNALARAASTELDVRQILRLSAATISAGLPGVPVALLLADGEAPGLVLGGSAGLSGLEQRALRSLARPDSPLSDQLAAGPDRLTLAGREWVTTPLRAHDRLVGALLVGIPPTESLDPALLESMATQLALSISNARSYKVIADLRDHLEIRVGERTAELEEARTSLQDTVEQLERADEAKAGFFTNVSHELRTPLTLLVGPLEDMQAMLFEGRTDDLAANLALAHRHAGLLQRLVNELLDFAKIDGGALRVEREELELVAVVGAVIDTLQPLADKRRISIATELSAEPVGVEGDPELLRRVVVNLLGNALKYARGGDHVTVRVHATDNHAVIEVQDNGPGIPASEHELVFERFRRGGTEHPAEGSGVGLSMSRDLVNAHGGTLELDSDVDRGALFRVRLPLYVGALAVPTRRTDHTPPAEADALHLDEAVPVLLPLPAPAPDPRVHPRTTVLLVEDNPDMREFLTQVLRREHMVVAVANGADAHASALRHPPDLVVSDVMMPGMDGLELCRRLKTSITTRRVPVILVSARHGAASALDAFGAGADDYVTKPFSPPELLARVRAQIRIRTLAIALLRMEKQHSLGVLSAGIAHEMLNPLNAVVNAVPPLQRAFGRMGQDPNTKDARQITALLDALEVSGRRMHNVVKGLLAYTRQDLDPRPVAGRLSEEIEAVLTILRYRLDNVEVHCVYEWDEAILHYPEWVDQVVMNLLVNALDAMPGGGEVHIIVDRVEDTVRIRVRDSGPGIAPELHEQIFTPFFTTKPPGKGTGLGLAIAREIVTLHRGSLTLESVENQGAEFVISLPIERASYAMER